MEQDKHVSKKPKLLVVVGSTGVGKTKLGVALAKQFDGEVVSCDSMQIYKVNFEFKFKKSITIYYYRANG